MFQHILSNFYFWPMIPDLLNYAQIQVARHNAN